MCPCDLTWRVIVLTGESSPGAAPTAATAGDGAAAGRPGPPAGTPLQGRPLPSSLPACPLRVPCPSHDTVKTIKLPCNVCFSCSCSAARQLG